jgi:hypothetical protein
VSDNQSQAAPAPDYGGGLVAAVERCSCEEALALRTEVEQLRARLAAFEHDLGTIEAVNPRLAALLRETVSD